MSSLNFKKLFVKVMVLVVMLFQLSFGDIKLYASAIPGQEVEPIKPIDDLWVAPMVVTCDSNIGH